MKLNAYREVILAERRLEKLFRGLVGVHCLGVVVLLRRRHAERRYHQISHRNVVAMIIV